MNRLSPSNLIPKEFLKPLIAVVQGEKVFDRNTGKWIQGTPQDIDFEGGIFPLTSRDLNQLQVTADGIFTVNDKKLYTTYADKTFDNKTQIKDGDKTYQVYVVKDYDIINPDFRQYFIKKIDKVDG